MAASAKSQNMGKQSSGILYMLGPTYFVMRIVSPAVMFFAAAHSTFMALCRCGHRIL